MTIISTDLPNTPNHTLHQTSLSGRLTRALHLCPRPAWLLNLGSLGYFSMRVLLLLLALVGMASGEDYVMYFVAAPKFHVPIAETPITLETFHRLNLILEIRTSSVEDQNRLVSLIVDDFRYDEPSYFADRRVSNITFEATVERNGVVFPVAARVSSQGGGGDLQYLNVDVDLELDGHPDGLDAGPKELLALLSAKKISEAEATARFKELRAEHAPNHPGVYTLRAHYRPKVEGKWKGELSTKTIKIVINGPK